MTEDALLYHASCVCRDDYAVLLCGKSGSGKSDLALRLIHDGFTLLADDSVLLSDDNGDLWADVPDNIAGLVEIRGLGIVSMPFVRQKKVGLKVVLSENEKTDRMPEPEMEKIKGIDIPVFRLNAFEASAVVKISYALDVAVGKKKRVS